MVRYGNKQNKNKKRKCIQQKETIPTKSHSVPKQTKSNKMGKKPEKGRSLKKKIIKKITTTKTTGKNTNRWV